MSSIFSWSTTPADNGTADASINFAEGQAPSTVNNSARQVMARVAELLKDLGGVAVAGGTANAITLTMESPWDALEDGLVVTFRAASANTDETTLNVNTTSAKPIVKMTSAGEAVLSGGEIQNDGIYELVYSADLNGAAGAWLLMNPAGDYVPTGIIAMWSGVITAIPTGWNLCDGTNSTPDLTNMFIVGAGNTYNVGDTGGSATVTLTEAQLPTVTPTFSGDALDAHGHPARYGPINGSSTNTTGGLALQSADVNKPAYTGTPDATVGHQIGGASAGTPSGTISSFGSDEAHENLPPYYALAFIMKT